MEAMQTIIEKMQHLMIQMENIQQHQPQDPLQGAQQYYGPHMQNLSQNAQQGYGKNLQYQP